jgi:aminoglycoside phosphotransferase (APT) family kinase protein
MDVLQFQGGMSNPTFLVRLENEKKFVLRKKPPGKLLPKAHAVDREFTVMSALQNTNIPVPKMVGYCGDPEVIGTEFFLMEYIEGRVVTSPAMEDFNATDRRDVYISLAKTMANLHKVDYLSAGLDEFGRPEGYLNRQINLWSNQYKKSRVDIQVSVDYQKMDWLCDWLKERADIEDEVAIAHGDYRLGNTIIHKDKPMVIGVLDWELSTIGHPLADLGYFCIPYRYGLDKQKLKESGIPSEEEFLDLYLRYSDRRDIQAWPTFLAFSLFRSAAIIFGVAARTTLGNVSTASSDINEQITRAQEMAIIGCEIASKSP